MPRQAHGRPLQPGRVSVAPKKKAPRNRGLNALEIAERENPDKIRIRQHRLGEVDDDSDGPRNRPESDGRSVKRRKLDNTQEEDSVEEGSDLEGNRWHEGVGEDDTDSDIDSEEAFGASDEEKFADFTFRGSASMSTAPTKSRKPAHLDLNEDMSAEEDNDGPDEDEDEDDLGADGIDLATAWDMDDEDDQETSRKRRRRQTSADSDASDDLSVGSGDGDEDLSDSDDDAQSVLSVSEDDGDHSRLQSFVEGLTSGDQKPLKKPRHIQSLPDKPSQFGLNSTKISAADLLQYIKDPRQRQSLKILQSNEVRDHEPYTGGIPGKLAPPLAKRQQDRLDRSAAYEETKKELGKWVETVKQNRRAEHLSFPLVDAAVEGMLSGKQLGPTSTSQPMTSLESTIQNIMLESGMLSKDHRSQENQEQAYEELHEKKMPLAEVQARRAELRRERDLMFREEIRARRIKKIKSKAYRRVHRKEREKFDQENRGLLAAQGLLNSDEEREKNDRRRAEERMGARHRESKWAKSVKVTGRAAWDEDARHGVTDLARRDEELRRRIEGKTDLGSDGSDSESTDFGGFSDSEDERNHLKIKLNKLDSYEPDESETRLGSMAFMKRAEAARKAANEQELRDIRRSLHQDDDDSEDEADSESDEATMGRQRFGPSGEQVVTEYRPQIEKSEFEERESDNELGLEPEDGQSREQEAVARPLPSAGIPRAAEHSAKNESPAKSSVLLPPARITTQSQQAKGSAVLSPQHTKPSKKIIKVSESHLDDYTSSSESDDEHDEKAELARAIFAGPDEIQQDFAKEKKKTVEDEGDHVIDNGLPGWGSWAGEGISKKAQKRAKGRFLTTIKGVAKEKRQDAKLDKVIINEKRIKKNSKYLANELPHPFESRQQYERSLRLPLGPEWTTKSTFQDSTKPRVLIKQGIIRPMARPQA